MLIYKDGITRTITNDEWQHFKAMGFVEVKEQHTPEPMVIEEEPKKTDKTKQDKKGD